MVAEDPGSVLSTDNPFYQDPLVSVVMTTVDAEEHILRALRSILDQTWRHVELLVVDDASTDGTLAALRDVNDPRLRVWRTPRRAGRRFCERIGIRHARGRLVALQDVEDWSHPTRLERQVRHLVEHPEARICGCHRVRVDARHKPLTDPAVAPRSAMFLRSILDELGPDEAEGAAADDALERRARTAWGDDSVAVLPDVLILGAQRDGSPPRVAPVRGKRRRAEPDEGDVLGVPTAAERLTASLATIASRGDALREVVRAILPQVDALRVYLNDYERVPDFLRHDKITAFLGREHAGDIADNGKFYRVEEVRGYHFTIDDDVAYPPDYIATLRARIDRYAGQAVVGVHGITIDYDRFEHYYDPRSRRVHSYRQPLAQDTAVHLLGTGTVGYHTSTLGVRFDELNHRHMADILFGLQAARAGVPLVCIERARDWLGDHEVPDGSRIFVRQQEDDAVQSRLVTEARLVARRPTGHYPVVPEPAERGAGRLEIPWRQATETVRLLGALLRESVGPPGVESLADLSYRPDAVQLGPFGSAEQARTLAARLRDTFRLDAAVLQDDSSSPPRYLVRAKGLSDTAAGAALKDELAGRHTRGDRYLRMGPFPNREVAQGIVHGLSKRLDDLGWALSRGLDSEARYRLMGFGYTSDAEGTYAEVHVAPRPTASGAFPPGGVLADPAPLPWAAEDRRAEWRRLVAEGREALAADDRHAAHRRLAAARELHPLDPPDLYRLACSLIRTGQPAAGVEILLEAAPGIPDVDALVEPLDEGLEGSPPRFVEEAWTALLDRRPDALPARRRLAEHHLRAKRPDAALRLFAEPPAEGPTREWEFARARVALRAWRLTEAAWSLARGVVLPGGPLRLAAPVAPEDSRPEGPASGPAEAAAAPAERAPLASTLRDPDPPSEARQDATVAESDARVRDLRGQVADLQASLERREALLAEGHQEAKALRASVSAAEAAARDHREALLRASSDLEIAQALLRHARHAAPDWDEAGRLRGLKVACVMDEFSHASFRHEFNALQLTPQRWRAEIEAFEPEMLFVESAWRGKDELWGNKVGHRSQEVRDIVAWCRARGVPTVFWNKEDPVHFETFLGTAELFDHVFTTDIDCIRRYKRALGHDRVYLLPFACQPRLTNPIERYDRKDAFCFAGAYYVRYPERTRDLENFVGTLAAFRPVEIYDRNHGKSDPNYQFPPEFQPFIVGSLPFDQIDRAYKGYRYAINLNSIKQSQSMFARRVFELLASNTVTISNFSRGVRLFFGDLVVSTDSGEEVVRRVRALAAADADQRKHRLAGLRKVMREHTYHDRFAYLLGKVRGASRREVLPPVAVTGLARSVHELGVLVEAFRRQTHANKRLVVLVPRGLPRRAWPKDGDIEVVTAKAAGRSPIGDLLAPGEWLASLSAADYHGPNFLLDLALATRYSAARAFGKVARFTWSEASRTVALGADGHQYRPVSGVLARAALVHRDLVADVLLADWLADLETRRVEDVDALALDEFNYCEGGGGAGFESEHAAVVDDLARLDSGTPLAEVLRRAEAIEAEEDQVQGAPVLTGAELAGYFATAKDPAIRSTVVGADWVLESSLELGKHTCLYSAKSLLPEDLGFSQRARFHLGAAPGLDVRVGILFLGAAGESLGTVVGPANRDNQGELPIGTVGVRLVVRIHGAGAARIHSLALGSLSARPLEHFGAGGDLVAASPYPTHDECRQTILVFTNLGVNSIDGSSIFITNWLNLFCQLDVDVHFLSTIEPGEHFLGRLTDPNRPVFHQCDKDGVTSAIQRLDEMYHYRRIFIRSWGPKALWYSATFAGKVSFYWPLTSEPSHEDKIVYSTVGSVVFQTAALREATVSLLGDKDSVLMPPIVHTPSLDAQPPLPHRDFSARMTFGYVGTLRAECYSKDLLQVMLDTLEAHRDVLFYLIIGKVHYADFGAKREVLALVDALRACPNAIVRERLEKSVCDAVLARCDVSFSLWEQTPANALQVSTKLLESLSLGCHVITFDTARHRQLLGPDYPGLISDIADLGGAVGRYLKVGKDGMTRFIDGHTLSQFSIERQVMTIASHLGAPVTNAVDHQRRLFHKQYDEIYGVFINGAEELKLRALSERHQIRMRFFRGTLGREELVREFAEYQKRGLRTPWERAAKRQRLSIGAMGHLYTFIRIAEDALARGLQKILVLEADVVLHREFFARHARLDLAHYRLLYLGAGMWCSTVEFTNNGMFYRPKQTTGTFAIALDASILEECIALWRQMLDPTDVALWHIQEKYRDECFVVSPNLAICDLTRSNTGHKRDQKELSARFGWRLADYDIAIADPVDRYVESMRIRVAHREPHASLRLHCARGVIEVPCDSSAIEIEVGDHVYRVEYQNLFIDEVEFS